MPVINTANAAPSLDRNPAEPALQARIAAISLAESNSFAIEMTEALGAASEAAAAMRKAFPQGGAANDRWPGADALKWAEKGGSIDAATKRLADINQIAHELERARFASLPMATPGPAIRYWSAGQTAGLAVMARDIFQQMSDVADRFEGDVPEAVSRSAFASQAMAKFSSAYSSLSRLVTHLERLPEPVARACGRPEPL